VHDYIDIQPNRVCHSAIWVRTAWLHCQPLTLAKLSAHKHMSFLLLFRLLGARPPVQCTASSLLLTKPSAVVVLLLTLLLHMLPRRRKAACSGV
jgi:hypothetical protein